VNEGGLGGSGDEISVAVQGGGELIVCVACGDEAAGDYTESFEL